MRLFFIGVRVIDGRLLRLIEAGEHRRFYKCKEWKRKRKQVLKRDNYECQRCKANGGYSGAVTVHHIQHLNKRPDLALVDSNLISLCGPCHNQEHPEKLRKNDKKKRFENIEKW